MHNLFNLSLPYLVNLLVSSTHSLSIVLTSIEPIEDWSMEEHASIVVAISQEINFLSKVSSVYNTREKANNCLLSSLLLSYIVVNYSKINQLLSDHICVPVVQPYRWSVCWSYCCSVCLNIQMFRFSDLPKWYMDRNIRVFRTEELGYDLLVVPPVWSCFQDSPCSEFSKHPPNLTRILTIHTMFR